MSLDKAIKHGKEKRKPYRGSKAFDRSCADNTCPWCLGNKLHRNNKRNPIIFEEEFTNEDIES